MLTRIPDWQLDATNQARLNDIETGNANTRAFLDTLLIDLNATGATLHALDLAGAGATSGEIATLAGVALANATSLTNFLAGDWVTNIAPVDTARAPIAPVV